MFWKPRGSQKGFLAVAPALLSTYSTLQNHHLELQNQHQLKNSSNPPKPTLQNHHLEIQNQR